jgi:hypothetical protein
MANEPFIDAWVSYGKAVRHFYDVAGPAVDERRTLEGTEIDAAEAALEQVVSYSQALTEIGLAQIQERTDGEYDRTASLLLAAAAVDVAVGCEALQVSPEPPAPDQVFADLSDDDTALESALELLDEADGLFGQLGPLAGAGVNPTRHELQQATSTSFDSLVHEASDPTLRFALGLLAGLAHGIAIPPEAATLSDKLEQLTEEAGRVKRHLVKLIASGYHKLVGVSGQEAEQLAQASAQFGIGQAAEALRRRVMRAVADLLGWLTRRPDAERDANAQIARPAVLQPPDAANITYQLTALTTAYTEQMKWTGRIAKWIARASPLISTLAAPVGGPAVVAGLDAVGVGFVLYTLNVRVDGHGMPASVKSVVAILEDGLAHLP